MSILWKRLSNAMAAGALFGVLGMVLPAIAGRTLNVPSDKYRTITEAMSKCKAGDTIWVQDGVYKEHITMPPEVVLKARNRHKVVLDGGRHATVVTMSRKNALIGVEVRNGTFGIFTRGSSNAILQCRIVNNWQTGIINVRNLARIEDNIIAFNGASGIQTWDVNVSAGMINHNTIAFNGNFGISIGGESVVVIENNVIAFNHRFGIGPTNPKKDWTIGANNFYGNMVQIWAMPDGNYSFDPAFIGPRTNRDFRLGPGSSGRDKTLDREIMGARVSN